MHGSLLHDKPRPTPWRARWPPCGNASPRDGLHLSDELQFIDEGYSGATLVRPALERLRDVVAVGAVDRLYVHSPDRLARKYAYQVLLVDEFQRAGVEVVFLNRELGQTPEDELLLQVQGMMAEYERAKILERHRRGKRHAAHAGSVNVLVAAPYGYRYIPKHDGSGQARYEILAEEARVVRQMFDWVGHERVTIGEVCRRLSRAGEPTRTGKSIWDRRAVWGMLRNPAYMGTAAFGKTRQGPLRPRLRAQRGGRCSRGAPSSRWRCRARSGSRFRCRRSWRPRSSRRSRSSCGTISATRGNTAVAPSICCRAWSVARGVGMPIMARASATRPPRADRASMPITGAWGRTPTVLAARGSVAIPRCGPTCWISPCGGEVRALLEHPDRLTEEYRRRLHPHAHARRHDLTTVEGQLGRLRQGLARLIDSYAEGLIEKREFEPRITHLRQRVTKLEEQAHQLADEAALHTELRLIIGRLEDFAAQVKDGLEEADWTSRREMIRALVKRVEVDDDQVHVVFRVDQHPGDPSPEKKSLQHCRRSNYSALWCAECRVSERPLFHHASSQEIPDEPQDLLVFDSPPK